MEDCVCVGTGLLAVGSVLCVCYGAVCRVHRAAQAPGSEG